MYKDDMCRRPNRRIIVIISYFEGRPLSSMGWEEEGKILNKITNESAQKIPESRKTCIYIYPLLALINCRLCAHMGVLFIYWLFLNK